MAILEAIASYKNHLFERRGLDDELYKWEVITKYQGIPDPDSEDFVRQIYSLNFGNLIYGPQMSAFRKLAKLQTEGYRAAMRDLFDESIDLSVRVTTFIDSCKKLWDGIKDQFDKNTTAMTDARLISAFLTCRYPEKYTFYKSEVYNFLCQLLNVQKKKPGEKLVHFYELLNTLVIPEVEKETELIEKINAELDSKNLIHSIPLNSQTVIWYAMAVKKYGTDTTSERIEEVAETEEETDAQVKKVQANSDHEVTTQNIVNENPQYWWLVANQKMFRFSDVNVGDTLLWTLYTQTGGKRRIFQNFLDAKVGDKVFCYQATPIKQIVALGEVSRENDGQTIEVRKIENLVNPIDYSQIKSDEALSGMEYFILPNGSFFKVTPDEANELMEIIRAENPLQDQENILQYTKADFLNEVFMNEKDYERLYTLIKSKKNIILQGAPGVGKTFTAKRLAYSILGEKNDNHVEIIQFHQNYSYEDFIMGYKPCENAGFELCKGIFFSFCERARSDREHAYFFIIDEINRGNLSKIFGELMMLIEKDYRDTEIKLSNRGVTFSVPSNVHIIGMMNTADRSLALIDYALRRRFSFFEITPGFDSKGFLALKDKVDNEKFNFVIDAVKRLNDVILKDDSLGSGFCIGHSYFCNPEEEVETWLENIVDYDIDPMLREYWFDNPDKYKHEIDKIRDALK